MNKRQYYVSELVNKQRLLEDSLQKARDGDECNIHYHDRGQSCNDLCHKVVLPKLDEGQFP